MPGRDTTFKNGYRYGFNGKEADREPYGVNNEYDYGMRIYDPRVGRFLSVDPLTDNYPELTLYQFASNTPIQASDLDGLEAAGVGFGVGTNNMNPENSAATGKALIEVGKGIGETVESAAKGLYSIVRHPLDFIHNGYEAGRHPLKTYNSINGKINTEVKSAQTNPAKFTGNVIGNFGLLAFGGELFKGSVISQEIEFLSTEEFEGLAEKGVVNPDKIRFSQNSISEEITDVTKSSKSSLEDFIKDLKSGKINPADVPPIRIVEKDGKIYTLDNRRLYAYQQAGVKNIRYEKLSSIPKKEVFKFTTTNEGTSVVVRKKS